MPFRMHSYIFMVAIFGSISFCSPEKSARGARASSGPLKNPIATTPPNLPGGKIANAAPPGPFFQDFTPPFPTDSWWAGFTVKNQDATVAGPFPFQAQTTNKGLRFGISDSRNFDGTSLHVNTKLEWNVFINDLPDDLNHRKALSWDTQTVCLQYFSDFGNKMNSCLVPGSPYMTFTFTNATVNIQSISGDIATFQWIKKGTKAKVTIKNGGTYLIYVVGGKTIDLTAAGATSLISPVGFSGTLRFAKVKAEGQEAILDRHVETYATGLTLTYKVVNDVATTNWTWQVVGKPADLLTLSWPHHRRTLQGAKFTDIQYLTLKGQMKGVVGNQWQFKHSLPPISWFAQNPPQQSCLRELNKTLEAEVKRLQVRIPGDFYFWGGSFGRDSRLALIAEHIGRTDLIQPVVNILKESANYWFDGSRKVSAAYETNWGGVINKNGWNDTWVDFGNGYYNDHHFHYGYLLHGAAVIGKYDPAWLQKNTDFFMHVARGIGNPSPNDPHYTVTRHMDFFAGHSWASGIANGAGPRDQESSGEAINGYYGLLLFARAIKNQPIIDYARYLLAIEIEGAQTYWHLYPKKSDPDSPYPEQGLRDLVTIGNVMDSQAGAWLFWGGQKIQIAAIQILPLTPIGQLTYDTAWIEQVLPYCQEEINNSSYGDSFKSVILAAYAKVNPQQAYNLSSNLYDWGSGNSASNQLYFISTQTSAKDICSAANETPEGLFIIQDVASGKFISVGSNGRLLASSNAEVLATKFTLGFVPGGGTIQAPNKKFVTASPDGSSPLSANRDTANSYEVFRWAKQSDKTYFLQAMVNRQQVSTTTGDGDQGQGQLQNNAGSTTGIYPSKYRLIETNNSEDAPPPARGFLQSVKTGKFVISTSADPVLKTTGKTNVEATTFTFDKVPDTSYYTIKSGGNHKYVTGDQAGKAKLSAARDAAQSWERFQIVRHKDNYIIVHVISGLLATLQSDDTIIDNTNNVDNSTLWNILPAAKTL